LRLKTSIKLPECLGIALERVWPFFISSRILTCNADVIHSSGFTRDLAIGTAMLGNLEDTFNQIWNLPVVKDGVTGREWVELFAMALNKSNKIEILSNSTIESLGLSDPVIRETYEMLYQYDRDYYFDSSKFNNDFPYWQIVYYYFVKWNKCSRFYTSI
jgi:hypothetical protein